MAIRYYTIPAKRTKEAILKMQKLIDMELMGMAAGEFTQFVRGQLFICAEYLLTNWQACKDPLDTDAELIVSFCSVLVNLICKWLSLAKKYFTLVSLH